MNQNLKSFLLLALLPFSTAGAQHISRDSVAAAFLRAGLERCEAHALLQELTSKAAKRLSGSPGAADAVALTRTMMAERGFDNVHLEEVMVPHWVRGDMERASVMNGPEHIPLTICALGGSIGTPKGGVTAEVIEVRTFQELRALHEKAKGKIVFFNRGLDPGLLNTFDAYSGAVDQRGSGAVEAAQVGGVAALVRSMTLAMDNVPHTGAMHYNDTVPKIPAAAISTRDANMLSSLLKQRGSAMVNVELSCETLPDVPSANVVGELTGS